jgi:hypothetical protein
MLLLALFACGDKPHDSNPTDSEPEVHDSDEVADDSVAQGVDADGDGWDAEVDCDDTDPDVNPGAQEICDDEARDEDCDGLADDQDPDAVGQRVWYADVDGDGYGDPEAALASCAPSGVEDDTDCDDGDPAVNPDAEEVCGDGLDNDCDGGLDVCRVEGELGAEAAWLDLTLSDGGYAGSQLAWVDLDGDGSQDLVVGDYRRQASDGSEDGGAYVAYGPLSGTLVEDASSLALLVVEDGEAGTSLSAGGDFDGDGQDDLVVTAPYATTDTSQDGLVSLILGGGPVLSAGEQDLAGAADQSWYGYGKYGRLGTDARLIGDVDGDGLDELVMGASNYSSGRGAVILVFGQAGLSGDTESLNDLDHLMWYGGGNYTYSGTGGSIAGVDLDGDGLQDLAAGEQYAHDNGSYAGEVHLFYGDSSFGPTSHTELEDSADADFDGEGDQRVGAEVLAAGDQDGDGYEDLWVQGIGGTEVDSAYGHVYLVSGQASRYSGSAALSSTSATTLTGDRSDELLGSSMSVGDLDDDGQLDLVAGSSAYGQLAAPPLESNSGSVRVFYGPLSGSLVSSDADASFASGSDQGLGRVLVHDSDEDGLDELMLSATSLNRVLSFEAPR